MGVNGRFKDSVFHKLPPFLRTFLNKKKDRVSDNKSPTQWCRSVPPVEIGLFSICPDSLSDKRPSASPSHRTKCVQMHVVGLLLQDVSSSNTGNDQLLVTHITNVCVTPSIQVLQKFMSRLVQSRAMAQKDLRTLSKYQLILARDQFRKNPQPNIKAGNLLFVKGCITLGGVFNVTQHQII